MLNQSLTSLEQRDDFIDRHIGPDEKDITAMLATLGAPSLDALIGQTVPTAIRLEKPLPIADAMPELERAVKDVIAKRGKLIIPSFAVGRSQEIVYCLNELIGAGRIPGRGLTGFRPGSRPGTGRPCRARARECATAGTLQTGPGCTSKAPASRRSRARSPWRIRWPGRKAGSGQGLRAGQLAWELLAMGST